MTELPHFRDATALLPAIVQDAATQRVLMLAWMNRAAWEATLATGEATFYSRSRGRLWKKGEQSGHVQRVREAYVDCDADAILLKVEQVGGAACHEGYESCFFRRRVDGAWEVSETRRFDPQSVYGSSPPPE
ncbi:MAG TPA: phosphoribosyl-AMP cyclohydrolase [Lacipirellulaceae bacterium]|nr:phosphoribosyl-AMP cyclohydrolase [Lacipirellulaceae bacterium]